MAQGVNIISVFNISKNKTERFAIVYGTSRWFHKIPPHDLDAVFEFYSLTVPRFSYHEFCLKHQSQGHPR